jgi:hypothetical protein
VDLRKRSGPERHDERVVDRRREVEAGTFDIADLDPWLRGFAKAESR